MSDSAPKSDAPAPPDPFEGHLAFLAGWESRRLRTLADRLTLPAEAPIGLDVTSMLDFDALEALASWQGLFQPPRDKRPGELDPDVEGQMKQCVPQFHLRNIGRYERYADPDDDLELNPSEVRHGLRAAETATLHVGAPEPIALLEVMNLDAVRGYQRRMRWLIHETDWNRHFSQELKASVAGPLWRYHADEDTADGGTSS